MPSARVLPKKYLGTLEQTQEELRLIAQKCKRAIIEIEAKQASHHLHSLLREVESTSYRLAFELSQLQIAGSCDGCPSAPPTTIAQAHLLVLADELERHAELARRRALNPDEHETSATPWPGDIFRRDDRINSRPAM